MFVRLAEKEEFKEVSELILQVHQIHIDLRPDIYKECDAVIDEKEYSEAVDEKRIYVGIVDERIVGVVLLIFRNINKSHQIAKKTIFIDIMVVDKKYRGIGCGFSFLEYIRKLKREGGYDAIELQVNAKNKDAIDVYNAYGFKNKSINMELVE